MSKLSVPEIWFKTQRVIRTVFAVVVSTAATVAAGILAVAVVAPQILDELAKVLPASWIAWATAAIATLATIAGVVTRIMAIPAVNAWLTKIGLGSVPRSNVDGDGVLPDPKLSTRESYQAAVRSRRTAG